MPYPLKKDVSTDPVPLGKTGWYAFPEYPAIDIEKVDGKRNPARGFIENWGGIFSVHADKDMPAYVLELYVKWIKENTVLTYIGDVPILGGNNAK